MRKNFLFLFLVTALLLPSVRCIVRNRMHMEIEPMSVEQSLTAYGDEIEYGAVNAIDMDTATVSTTFADPATGLRTWFRVNFDKVYCIEEIKWFRVNGIDKYFLGDWIKGADGTWSCIGHVCDYLIVDIQNSGREANYRPVTEDGCNFGDTVHLELGARVPSGEMEIAELAVVGRRVDASCEAGYSLVEGSCEECPENSFSADGDNMCTPCPEGSTSPAGSSECNTPQYPTCECWTPECGYCTNMNCTLQTNISVTGLEVTARLKWKELRTMILYDQDGEELGRLHWSRSKILLTHCISCLTPQELRIPTNGAFSTWTFLMQDGFFRVQVGGEIVYQQKMSKRCWKRYQRASRFAFTKMSCENSFSFVKDEMELGDMMTSDCSGTCPQGEN